MLLIPDYCEQITRVLIFMLYNYYKLLTPIRIIISTVVLIVGLG